MRRALIVLLGSLLSPLALAGAEVHRLTWDLSIDGKAVGSRQATITVEHDGARSTRFVEAFTEIDATIGPAAWTYKQRLTVVGETHPAAFHAVMQEDGKPREVQARWTADGWTVTLADAERTRTYQTPASRIDLSTADLIDPGSRVPLDHFDEASLLSAETGDVWSGRVERLGASTVKVAGKAIPVEGVAWTAPVGRYEFWYDADGWLVRYATTVLGHPVEGRLASPPPPSPDAFKVRLGEAEVEAADL